MKWWDGRRKDENRLISNSCFCHIRHIDKYCISSFYLFYISCFGKRWPCCAEELLKCETWINRLLVRHCHSDCGVPAEMMWNWESWVCVCGAANSVPGVCVTKVLGHFQLQVKSSSWSLFLFESLSPFQNTEYYLQPLANWHLPLPSHVCCFHQPDTNLYWCFCQSL